jgi:tetratricopeptide (TPR) repeat protein
MWRVLLLVPCAMWAQDALSEVERLIAADRYAPALEALRQRPASTARWHLLASKAYAGTGDPARAVAEAEAALALDPRSQAAHLQLGQIFLSNHTPLAAHDIFAEALTLFPDSFLLRLGDGLALKELMRYDEAARQLRQCLAAQPASGIVFDALATVLLHSSDFEGLLRLTEEHTTRNPADYRGYYYAAAGRDGLRLPDPATLQLLEQSLARNPDFAATYALKGKVLLRQASVPEAVAALERAVALRPDHVPSHMALANAYRKLGDEAGAIREFSKVRELNEAQRTPPPSLIYHRGQAAGRP